MNSPAKTDAVLEALQQAKASSGLPADDPSIIALEQIMLAKVAELSPAKLDAAIPISDAIALDKVVESDIAPPAPSELPPALFAPIEEEAPALQTQPGTAPNKRP